MRTVGSAENGVQSPKKIKSHSSYPLSFSGVSTGETGLVEQNKQIEKKESAQLNLLPDHMHDSSETGPIDIGRFEERIRCRGFRRPHRHDYHQVWLINGGGAVYALDFVETRFDKPVIVFAPSGSVHTWKEKGTATGFMLCFSDEFFRKHNLPVSVIQNFPPFDPVYCFPQVNLEKETYFRMDLFFRDLEREYLERQQNYQCMLALKVWELLLMVERTMPASIDLTSTRYSSLTNRFLRLVSRCPVKIRTPSQIANHLHVSRSWLNQVVREETGMNTTEQIQNHVLREAKRLLAYSDLTVQQIAFELGFEDPGYFTRLFRMRELKTPNEFRLVFR